MADESMIERVAQAMFHATSVVALRSLDEPPVKSPYSIRIWREIARAAIEAMPPQWQPIETAPRDGEPFLAAILWEDTGEWEILRMSWYEHAQRFGDPTYAPFIDEQEQPRCWMPLPDPPPPASLTFTRCKFHSSPAAGMRITGEAGVDAKKEEAK